MVDPRRFLAQLGGEMALPRKQALGARAIVERLFAAAGSSNRAMWIVSDGLPMVSGPPSTAQRSSDGMRFNPRTRAYHRSAAGRSATKTWR